MKWMPNQNLKINSLNQKGMTLVEIMIVLVIVGGLMTILATQVMPKFFSAQTKQAKIQTGNIMKELEAFYLDCQTYPTSEVGLRGLVTKPESCANWNGPYIKKEAELKDPWGNEFLYESNGSTYVVKSLGKGGQEGGSGNESDISSEEL
jgi:general secretion pathway protein G